MSLTTEGLRAAWLCTVIPVLEAESIPLGVVFAEASVSVVDGWIVLCEFAPSERFLAKVANDRRNRRKLEAVLRRLTGERELSVGVKL